MTWWYENEEEEMKLYKDEDLCIECKNEFFSKPYDHRDPTPGTIGYCIKCDNFLIKEKKMEFDKSRVYIALNADELKRGDKVFVANSLNSLKRFVEKMLEKPDGLNPNGIYVKTIYRIRDFSSDYRFDVKPSNPARPSYPYAYLVERAENCTNCEGCEYKDKEWMKKNKDYLINRCENYKPKNKKEIDMNWNYEGLPEKQEMGVSDRVVVAVKGYNIVDIGYYDYELEAWFVDGNRYPVPVYAWMEVKPPKEEA